MPLTDMADLMDRMATLLATAPLEGYTDDRFQTGPKSESLLGQPMPDLTAAPRSFAQVFGSDGQLLAQLGRDATAQGQPDLAALFHALDTGLREGGFEIPNAPKPAPRLGRYVYPVV